MSVSRFGRVNQWLTMARQWHVVDAKSQDAYVLGEKVAKHLAGRHKPIWHPETDCGDHVVVINCRHVAMHAFDWKHRLYHFDKQYPKSKALIPAYQIHEYDPTRIMFLAVYKALGNSVVRRMHVQRLHLFADADMPEFVQKNLGNQLRRIQPVPKRSDEYTAEERNAFPRLFEFEKDFVEDWKTPIEPHERFVPEQPKK